MFGYIFRSLNSVLKYNIDYNFIDLIYKLLNKNN